MALNKDVLGAALYTKAQAFNEQDIAPADLEQARQDFFKGLAEAIVEHITSAATVSVTVATTGTAAAQTGTGTGTIS